MAGSSNPDDAPGGFSTLHRSQPPARRREDELTPLTPVPRSVERHARSSDVDLVLSPDALTREPEDASGAAFERRLPDLGVSNEALLASLRPAPPDNVITWVKRRLRALWLPIERRFLDALYWLFDRPLWQGVALSAGCGALFGLGLIVAYASSLRAEREAAESALESSVQPSAEPPTALPDGALLAAPAAALVAQQVVQRLSPTQEPEGAVAEGSDSARDPSANAADEGVAPDGTAAESPPKAADEGVAPGGAKAAEPPADEPEADSPATGRAKKADKRKAAKRRAAKARDAKKRLPTFQQMLTRQRAAAKREAAAARQ